MNAIEPIDLIRECRSRSGLDQRGLARDAGISEVTISRILNGHSDGGGKTLRKLRSFLRSLEPIPEPPQDAA